jgi:hypothetical protein
MDRTNVTSSGYTFNGQNFTNETRTDSQGNNYTVAVPSTISTATLSAPTTLPVTQPQYNTSGQQSLASQAGAYVNTATTAAEQALQAEQDALKASQTDVGRLLTDAGNKGTDIASQYNQQDATGQSVNSLAAKLRQLSARSNALSIDNLAKSEAEINKATGQNITSTAVRRNTADATRENLINQASIAMELAIVDADYQSAKSYADQMVDAKYDQLEANTKAALFNLENNKERFTAAEKKVAEATAARLRKEERDIETQKANEKAISDLVINAATQDAPKSLRDKAALAKTPAEAANILGVYAGDYLKNELLKEQIKKTIADTAKTRSEIVKIDNQSSLLKTQPTGVVTAPNGDAIGIPNETIAAIGKLKLNEGQANAVAFTSRMIQSAQALDKQLGEIKPTGGFYETSGYDPTSAGSSIGRLVGSDQSRVYSTNSQDFIRAKLRKESGATIGKDEFEADAAIYTPSGAGLDEKDLLLAQTKRDEAIKSMIAQAGPAAPYLQQYYEQSKTQGDAFVSANPQLNEWYKNTTSAVNTSTAQAATSGGTYGFSDNQK